MPTSRVTDWYNHSNALYHPLILEKKMERRLRSGHLWIYSNEINQKITPLKQFAAGDLVSVCSYSGKSLGIAYVNPNCLLCARIITKISDEVIDRVFFVKRLRKALSLRELYYAEPFYRLVFGEGDLLPGLVIDRYGQFFVVQSATAGMDKCIAWIIEALIEIFQPQGILLKNDSTQREVEGIPTNVEVAYGNIPDLIEIKDRKMRFYVSLLRGQKTGWFYDHLENRKKWDEWNHEGKRVLDVFSYLGAWGIAAACCGTCEVVCIDSSAKACQLLKRNAELNDVSISIVCEDAFSALKKLIQTGKMFDHIVLDPPALIKKRKDMQEGMNAYFRLNEMAVSLLAPDGILFTSSCSMLLQENDLLNIIRRVSLKLNCTLAVVERLHQGIDHPVHPAIPETSYLKGFVVIKRR